MKDFFKIIIASIIVTLIGMIGIWGFETSNSDTEWGWKLWGLILANAVVIIPTVRFWARQVSNIIDLD